MMSVCEFADGPNCAPSPSGPRHLGEILAEAFQPDPFEVDGCRFKVTELDEHFFTGDCESSFFDPHPGDDDCVELCCHAPLRKYLSDLLPIQKEDPYALPARGRWRITVEFVPITEEGRCEWTSVGTDTRRKKCWPDFEHEREDAERCAESILG